MNIADRIYREAQALPEAQAKEVLDFLEFLRNKLKKTAASETKGTSNADALPGFGMWADHDEMSDILVPSQRWRANMQGRSN